MRDLIRRAWQRGVSARGVPELSRVHLWEEGRVWSLCGVVIPCRFRGAIREPASGMAACRRCEAIREARQR